MSIRLSTGGFGLPQVLTRGLGGITFLYADDFWEGLKRYILSIESLSGLQGVYYRRTPPRFDMPCLIFTPISDIPQIDNSETFWDQTLVQFTVLSNDDVEADSLGLKVYRAICPKVLVGGKMFPRPRIKAFDCYEMTAIPGVRHHAMQAGRGPENKNVWAFHCQFTFMIGRTMIENG